MKNPKKNSQFFCPKKRRTTNGGNKKDTDWVPRLIF
jgi:hypothetical protein